MHLPYGAILTYIFRAHVITTLLLGSSSHVRIVCNAFILFFMHETYMFPVKIQYASFHLWYNTHNTDNSASRTIVLSLANKKMRVPTAFWYLDTCLSLYMIGNSTCRSLGSLIYSSFAWCARYHLTSRSKTWKLRQLRYLVTDTNQYFNFVL